MYFPTSNHYFNDLDNLPSCDILSNIENNECLICLEINDSSNNICIRIQNKFYIKECLCDGWIHEVCLDFWYVSNKQCPICLCNMIKYEARETHVQLENTNYNGNNILSNRNNFCFLIKYIIICFTFYNLFIIFYYNIENIILSYSKIKNQGM